MQEQTTVNALAQQIRHTLASIATTWEQARLITTPTTHSNNSGEHTIPSAPGLPFNADQFDKLEEAETIIKTAGRAFGIWNEAQTPAQTARALIAKTDTISHTPDARRWLDDLEHCLQLLENVSGESGLAAALAVYRFAVWSPARLAVLLSAVLGCAVQPLEVTHARENGHVTVERGRVSVRELVDYFRTKKRKPVDHKPTDD